MNNAVQSLEVAPKNICTYTYDHRSIDKSSQQSNFNYRFFKLLQSKSVKFINLPVPNEEYTQEFHLNSTLQTEISCYLPLALHAITLTTLKIHIDHHIKLKLEHFSFPIPIYHWIRIWNCTQSFQLTTQLAMMMMIVEW